MIDTSQGEIQVTIIQPNDCSKYGVGKDWAGPFFPPLYYFLTFLFISQSLGLTYSCTVSEHS